MTQELVKELFDYKGGVLHWKIKPCKNVFIGDIAGGIYVSKKEKRVRIKYNNKNYFASRLIFLMHHGYMPVNVDHKDRNALNDKIENLRAATSLQNATNRTKVKTSKSKYLGVTPVAKCKTWRAIININGVQKYIGSFKTEDQAGLAYNEYALLHHGEFANLNII